ncbi:MAG: GNAT family N-acetyltransferase [Nocardioides sp.]
MDLTLRPLLTDDIPLLARLLAAVEEVDRTGEHYNEDDLAEEFANPDIEVGKDIVGAFLAEELVGYFAVYPRSTDDTHMKIHVEGSVVPARRGEGIGTRVVSAMLARADDVHAERHPERPAKINLTGLSANTEQESVAVAAGMVPERWNFVMRAQLADLDLDDDLSAVPEGLRVLPYAAELDRAMHEAHNAAFVDHPDFTPWTEVMWKQWVRESRNFRPGLSLLVVEEDRPEHVVAYVQSNEYDAYFEATGRREAYVAKVGTRREHRGRGLAGMLLRRSLVLYRDAGFDEASLDVDSENPTGALGIYQRAGFEVESRWTNYASFRDPVHG